MQQLQYNCNKKKQQLQYEYAVIMAIKILVNEYQ